MNRIIILGSTGFLGRSLRQKLSDEKFNVKYMVHKKQKNLQKNEFFGDVLDKKSLLKIVKDNDVIVNLVGQYSKNLSKFFDINIKGGLNLIEIAKIKKTSKLFLHHPSMCMAIIANTLPKKLIYQIRQHLME